MKPITTYLLLSSLSIFITCQAFSQGIEISSGALIQAIGSASIEITDGNFTNNGTYMMGTENLTFSGTSNGSISGLSNNDFYTLTVNNSNGVLHSSNGYVAINNLLTFSNGLLNTDTNYIIINDNATVSGATTLKYINGSCRKVGDDMFVFPIGNRGKYAPIAISNPNNTTDHFTATYYYKNPDSLYSVSLLESGLHNISTVEYWLLDRTNGTSNVNVSLYWDNTSRVSNLPDLRVARWNDTMWVNQGNLESFGDTTSGNISSDLISDFSPFTFASITATNALPIKLISFDATLTQKNVELIWITETEVNNDYFTIEKSSNLENWEEVIQIKSIGNNSTKQYYNTFDKNPFFGISYYRLKQIDFNGEYSYSKIAVVNYKYLTDISIYPNPVKDVLNIKTSCNDCQIKVYSTVGQLIYSGNSEKINTDNWTKGIYEVVIFNSIGEIKHKTGIVK